MTSHPSKHIQHVHTWKPEAAASLDEGREGEGPQELEGRVRILLGVLERERRGREEEQQKKRELERALEEAQVRKRGTAKVFPRSCFVICFVRWLLHGLCC